MVLHLSERAASVEKESKRDEEEKWEREMRKSGNPAHVLVYIDFFLQLSSLNRLTIASSVLNT